MNLQKARITPAQCPTCHGFAELDLRASMFHRSQNFYVCGRCDQRWTVDKRNLDVSFTSVSASSSRVSANDG
jgi:ssDNA-binding Zn-finger/Zn-ribbon topoisomerase 1